MSYQCVQAVLESELPRHRKLTLTALAERATPDGSVMWASIDDLAKRASKTRRIVTRDLAWLEEQGIISEVSGRRVHGAGRANVGGRNRCPRYRLNFEVLAAYRQPQEPCPDQGFESNSCPPDHGLASKPCPPDHGLASKPCPPDHGFNVASSAETMIPGAETMIRMAETMIHGSSVPKEPKEPSSNAAAAPPPSLEARKASPRGPHASLSRIPAADGNVRVIAKVADAVFEEAGRSSPDDPDLIELVKVKCAQQQIAYAPPEVPLDTLSCAMTLAHMRRTVGRRAS